MGLPITTAISFAAADDDGIAASQTPLAAGNLTINGALASGGVATIATVGLERPVLFTFAGADAARSFVIYGTNGSGGTISETVSGANASTSTTTLNYRTVTRISVDAATAGALTVGTTGVGYSEWKTLNPMVTPAPTAVSIVVANTINFDLQYCYTNPGARDAQNIIVPPTAFTDEVIVGQTASQGTIWPGPVYAGRLKVNSGTGTATMTMLPAGVAGP